MNEEDSGDDDDDDNEDEDEDDDSTMDQQQMALTSCLLGPVLGEPVAASKVDQPPISRRRWDRVVNARVS